MSLHKAGYYDGYFKEAALPALATKGLGAVDAATGHAGNWLAKGWKLPATLAAGSTVGAAIAGKLLSGSGKFLDEWYLPILMVAPPAAGVAIAYYANHLTSPTKKDVDLESKRLEIAEHQRLLVEVMRRRQQEAKEESVTHGPAERSLRL